MMSKVSRSFPITYSRLDFPYPRRFLSPLLVRSRHHIHSPPNDQHHFKKFSSLYERTSSGERPGTCSSGGTTAVFCSRTCLLRESPIDDSGVALSASLEYSNAANGD